MFVASLFQLAAEFLSHPPTGTTRSSDCCVFVSFSTSHALVFATQSHCIVRPCASNLPWHTIISVFLHCYHLCSYFLAMSSKFFLVLYPLSTSIALSLPFQKLLLLPVKGRGGLASLLQHCSLVGLISRTPPSFTCPYSAFLMIHCGSSPISSKISILHVFKSVFCSRLLLPLPSPNLATGRSPLAA